MTAALREALATLRDWLDTTPHYMGDAPKAQHYQRRIRVLETAIAALAAQVPKDQCGNHLDRFPCKTCGAAVPVACPRFESDRLAALSAQVPEDDARLVERLRLSLIEWLEANTGFSADDDEQEYVLAYYGGNWIGINVADLARHLAADRIEVLSSGQGRI